MEITREERQQQREARLRGAQRRQVKDVDFGFDFPILPAATPASLAEPVLSGTTPQRELTAQLSSDRERSRLRSVPAEANEEDDKPTAQSANDANTSAKRRRLGDDPDHTALRRSTRTSLHAPSAAVPTDPVPDQVADIESQAPPHVEIGVEPVIPNDLVEELEVVRPEQTISEPLLELQPQDQAASKSAIPSSIARAITPPLLLEAEEVTESPRNAPGSGHRKRVRLNEATLPTTRLAYGDETKGPVDVEMTGKARPGSSQRKRKMGEGAPKVTERASKRSRRSVSIDLSAEIPQEEQIQEDTIYLEPIPVISATPELDELSPEPRQQRKRRPPIEQVIPDVEEVVLNDTAELAEEIDDQEAATILKRDRGQRTSRRQPRAESLDLDEFTEEIPVASQKKKTRTKQRHISSPAKQNQPKKPSNLSKKAVPRHSTKPGKQPKARKGSPIPITVHRLSERLYYEDDAPDADVLNSEIPYTRRGGVNAIDVLGQICHEVIESALDKLEEGVEITHEKGLKREYKRKWQAVDSFGKVLQTRLLEHTINLDNTFALEKRVRDEQKKKLAFRNEILRIRVEREQIALRMDEIRIRHEQETKQTQERDTLNAAMNDIEMAIERGQRSQDPDEPTKLTGIELLLRRVAGTVSNKSDSGGMLKQVKDFNAFLERAALALETRKA